MAQVARTRVSLPVLAQWVTAEADRIVQHRTVAVLPTQTLVVDKVVAIHTSGDPATSEPLTAARSTIRHAGELGALQEAHREAWRSRWTRSAIDLGGPDTDETLLALRLHLFHLLQVVSPHVVGRDVGVPARGLHGEAYRGHVFWDEMFILPLFDQTDPALSRALLEYRWRRLDAARALARCEGLQGAMYPWQSGSSGREESQVVHLNPRSGRWVPDETHRQRHVGAAVAHSVWRYVETTSDLGFLEDCGAEMIVEIARLFASLARFDESLGRFRIRGVVGPDEFHTHGPDGGGPGLDDNTYTNVLASWCLRRAEDALGLLPTHRREELIRALRVTTRERARWQEIARSLHVPMLANGLIAQFDGYDRLEELDWTALDREDPAVARLDRLLEARGDTVDRYKASKQADLLMLFYLFDADELAEQLAYMGQPFDRERIPDHIRYYLSRTTHGSTLSRVVHAWVLARTDRAASWPLFVEALRADLRDTQGGTTAEGVHLGAMAGTVDLIRRCYPGARIVDGVLHLAPRLPDMLDYVELAYRVAGAWLHVRLDHGEAAVTYRSGRPEAVEVCVDGIRSTIANGETVRFPLRG